jgi:hypothetical protein
MTLIATSQVVAAEPPRLPPSEAKTVAGERWQCYDFENFKLLLKFEADHQACIWKQIETDERDDQLKEQVDALRNVVKLHEASIGDLRAENDRLFKQWSEENKLRHEAENKPQLGSWIAWSVAGVSTAVLAGFIIRDLTE